MAVGLLLGHGQFTRGCVPEEKWSLFPQSPLTTNSFLAGVGLLELLPHPCWDVDRFHLVQAGKEFMSSVGVSCVEGSFNSNGPILQLSHHILSASFLMFQEPWAVWVCLCVLQVISCLEHLNQLGVSVLTARGSFSDQCCLESVTWCNCTELKGGVLRVLWL